MGQSFTKFMVDVRIGTNRKIRRLTVGERWVYVAGVLALAAQSPMRGALLISDDEPVTPKDIASEASVSERQARAAMASLISLGMLDEDADGVLWVHDWDKLNPDPKPSNSPEATRERKRKQRRKDRAAANVTRDRGVTEGECHAPEVEEEEELTPPYPPQAGGAQTSPHLEEVAPPKPAGVRGRDLHEYRDAFEKWSLHHFPAASPDGVHRIVSALRADRLDPTASAVVGFAERHPNFALLLTEEVAA